MSGYTQQLVLDYLRSARVATTAQIRAAVEREYPIVGNTLNVALCRMTRLGRITRQRKGVYAAVTNEGDRLSVAGTLDYLESHFTAELTVELERRGWVRAVPETTNPAPGDKVIAWLRVHPCTSSQLADLLGITPRHAAVRVYQLRQRGLVEPMGIPQRGQPCRYRLRDI